MNDKKEAPSWPAGLEKNTKQLPNKTYLSSESSPVKDSDADILIYNSVPNNVASQSNAAGSASYPGPVKFPVTLISAKVPELLSKKFRLTGEGKLEKIPGGQLAEGVLETLDFLSFADFAADLQTLTPRQAMVYGITRHAKARVVTKDQLSKSKDARLPTIARTREHFRFPAGPAIMMIDHDTPEGAAAIPDSELLSRLYNVCPALEKAPHLVTQSVSSFIYHGETELIGQRGRRVYVLVAEGHDIVRAGPTLFKRLQLAGFGHIVISNAGQLLERGLIDPAVYQPERLDFCGGAACDAPLEQRRPAPKVFNAAAAPLDTRTAIPDLTILEDDKRQALVQSFKDAKKHEAAKRRTKWADEQVKRVLAKGGKTAASHPDKTAKLREVYLNATDYHDLYREFELRMSDGTTATVGEVLANPDKYHGRRCADPLEPSYGNDARIAVLNLRAAGNPYIYSHAHGGIRYALRRERFSYAIQNGERPAAVEFGLDVMRRDGSLFEHSGELVRVTDKGGIVPLSRADILFELDRLVRWQKYSKKGEKAPCDCPRPVAEGVAAMRGQWGLPKLDVVATAPLYHPRTGRIIAHDGFDAETGILLVCPYLDRWPGIPTKPTLDDVKDALNRIWVPFREFPFCGKLDRGVFLASVFTAMERPAYATAPGFLITASTAGSGKSLLANCLSSLAGAVMPAVMPGVEDNTEMRKRLVAVGRRGVPVIVLDNLSGFLESDALCAWLTTQYLSDRILGASEEITVRTSGLVLATGNNVLLKGDLCRRILVARIEPNIERPWKRSFDLNPASYCLEKRLELISDGLTIIKYYLNRPNPLKERMASFEEWSDTIRCVVVGIANDGLMDVADPVESIDEAYAEDPETAKLNALLLAWGKVFADTPTLVKEAMRAFPSHQDLNDVIHEIAGERGIVNVRRLGRWIERHARRRVEGRWFEPAGKRQGSMQWRVRHALPEGL